MANIILFIFYCSTLIILVNSQVKSLSEVKGKLPDPIIISRMFNEFLRPIMRYSPLNNPLFDTVNETEVEKAIREKIEELKPQLQDNNVSVDEDNLLLEGKDDTTIIEFLPKTEPRENRYVENDSFKGYLKKYKKMREKIDKALTKESVSDKTKNLVIKTLDSLIKSLVGSQCKWKRNLRAKKYDKPSIIATKWNSGMQKIKDKLRNLFKNNSEINADILDFFDAIHVLLKTVAEDAGVISKKYKILCDFVPKEHSTKPSLINSNALRNNWDKTDLEEERCQNVVICSNELRELMRNFYQALNDTTVSVLNNYSEMYIRDVNFDNENDKQVIVSLLNKMTDSLEDNVTKAFIKETYKLVLDKDKNINALSGYVKNTIEAVKNVAENVLKLELPEERDKIMSVIVDDININLDVDLGNLEREFLRKICVIFSLCNGRLIGRRQGSNDNIKNQLYVQVQLTLDDDMTNITSYRKFLNVVTPKNNTVNRFSSMTNLTVTRTTLVNNFTNTN